jgi:hypothetical protein
MKKLFVLFTLILFAFFGEAQTVKSFWGTAADTLTKSVAKTQVIPISSNETKDFVCTMVLDTAGMSTDTVVVTFKTEISLDGAYYHAIPGMDNQTHAGDGVASVIFRNSGYKTISVTGDTTSFYWREPLLGKYLKVTATASSATQKTRAYGYYILVPYKD